jgi:hypothetical protein
VLMAQLYNRPFVVEGPLCIKNGDADASHPTLDPPLKGMPAPDIVLIPELEPPHHRGRRAAVYEHREQDEEERHHQQHVRHRFCRSTGPIEISCLPVPQSPRRSLLQLTTGEPGARMSQS